MMEIPTTEANLARLFCYTVNLYNYKQFPDFKGVYQFILTEANEEYHYHIIFTEGKAEYHEGTYESPSIIIYSPVSVWYDICNGRLSGAWGWLTGKYHIKGSFYYLSILNKLLARKFTDEDIPGIEEKIADFEMNNNHSWKKSCQLLNAQE